MRSPVFGVVPHYNQVESLTNLLPQMEQQGYDHIIVLDDNSSEDREQLRELHNEHAGDDVSFHFYSVNVGAGANRNRVFHNQHVYRFGHALLHFLDADVELESDESAAKVHGLLDNDHVGLAGGLINTTEDRQMAFNYGPAFTVRGIASGALQLYVDSLISKGQPGKAAQLRQRFSRTLQGWPDTGQEPQATQTAWVAEANLAIRGDALAGSGGFIETRYGDVQGPAINLARAGKEIHFDPRIAVKHLTGGGNHHPTTPAQIADGTLHIAHHYGWGRFLFTK